MGEKWNAANFFNPFRSFEAFYSIDNIEQKTPEALKFIILDPIACKLKVFPLKALII